MKGDTCNFVAVCLFQEYFTLYQCNWDAFGGSLCSLVVFFSSAGARDRVVAVVKDWN